MPYQSTSRIHPVPEGVILVVDDEPNVLNLVVRLLAQAGYRAIACSSPGVVLDRIGTDPVVAVISDICMPEMSGFALSLRVHERYPDLPVVLMAAGRANPELAPIAMDFGAFAFLQKPFQATELWSVVNRALKHSTRVTQKRAG